MLYERKTPAGWAVHPGDILKHEFLKPMGISGYSLAKALGITAQRISDITTKKSGISADMAMLLGAFFGTSAEFWMNLQSSYALGSVGKKIRNKAKKIKPHTQVA
jgi:addiction module HigA family antidote